MRHFNWSNIRLILIFSLVIFLYSFTSSRNNNRKLTKSVVVFVDDNAPFVKQETVNKLLIENKSDVKSISKDKVNLSGLEKSLNSHDLIETSDVFVTIDGVLKTVVKQKTPIARIFDKQDSFYIDYKGNKMPLSANYTARVPLVSGFIKTRNNSKLTELLRIIYNDEFLKKNIIGVQIMPNASMILRNRNYDYQIDFGGTIRMNAKLNNYKVFFQKAVLDSSLNKYKTIDLRFAQQVVCTKK
jgi:cell division protein FtsQ